MISPTSIALGIIASTLGAIGAYFVKKGAVLISRKKLLPFQIVIGGTLYTLATVVFIEGLRGIPLSFYFPLNALQYLFASLLGFFGLGEKMTTRKIAGITIIILGIALNSVGR